jgi:hypothetical protein
MKERDRKKPHRHILINATTGTLKKKNWERKKAKYLL